MKIVKRHIPDSNYNNPKTKIKPDTIVVHYFGQPNVTGERLAECFKNNNANNVSSNFIVDSKTIIECIPAGYMSYCVTAHNDHTINIECAHTESGQFDIRTMIHLREIVLHLMKEFNIDKEHVVRHYDLTGKHCPMFYVKNKREWELLHRYITDEKGVL